MGDGYYREVIRLIRSAGFVYVENAKGSHEKWRHPESGRLLLVPKNLASRHTANGILKDAGLGKAF